MRLLTFIFVFAIIAAAMICTGYCLASFKARRFNSECIYLDDLIKRSEVSGTAYDDINRAFNDLDCLSKEDERRKRSLWSSFQYKFKSISPYRIKE